jgi:hypothetical protein
MSKRIKDNLPFLQNLLECSKGERMTSAYKENMTLGQIRTIYELDYNYHILVSSNKYKQHLKTKLSRGIRSSLTTGQFKAVLSRYDRECVEFVKSCFPLLITVVEANCSNPI